MLVMLYGTIYAGSYQYCYGSQRTLADCNQDCNQG